ncbi:nucleoside deaminase [Microbacterium sp. NPDC056569]|uniref:nucleoside deaminase n=1 Tax=Microbacterium sp. NPDC056569 TaxID=3345867 RepID=UPI00366AC96F
MDAGLEAAFSAAVRGASEGGIPIGSALVIDGKVVATGYNRRVQRGSVVLHAEMDCLEAAGRLPASEYARATLYTTLSPCDMCTGAVLLYGIPRVVVGEERTFVGGTALLRDRGVHVEVVDDPACERLLAGFVRAHPQLWNEDIGVIDPDAGGGAL